MRSGLYSRIFSKRLVRRASSLIPWKENNNVMEYQRVQTRKGVKFVKPDFSDIKHSMKMKTDAEIVRALSVLYLCSFRFIAKNGGFFMKTGKLLLGERIFKFLLKSTIYGQFAGGETQAELTEVSLKLNRSGISMLLMLGSEDDLAQITNSMKYHQKLLTNLENALECVKIARQLCAHVIPMIHFKMTAFAPQSLLAELGTRTTKVDNFRSYALELSKLLSENITIEQTIFNTLSPSEQLFLTNAIGCLRKFGDKAINEGVRLMVDAEYLMLNRGIQLFAMALILKHNSHKPLVWNTHQCYLISAYQTVLEEIQTADFFKRCWGAKIVRGAYMDFERRAAAKEGKPSPINDSFERTSEVYDKTVRYILTLISKKTDRYSFISATHNQQSILNVIDYIEKLGIDPSNKHVSFGQLYGLSDNVTCALGMGGYNVYKSVPYGDIMDVLPYLSRRAVENSSFLPGMSKERKLLSMELRRRLRK